MRVAIIGGGILGAATARLITSQIPGAEVQVFEKEPDLARHQTSHSSGVVHAGLYYTPGSLKARLCVRGMSLLRDFCRAHSIRYDACGKLVIATEVGEMPRFEALEQRARANGVPGLRRLDGSELRSVEPHAQGLAALHSPATAIVDFAEVARAMAADATAAGASIHLGREVARVDGGRGAARIELVDGGGAGADRVIVCAGLHADRLARRSGQPAEPRIVPFRGEYWQLRPERSELVRGLIYPVPDPALPFLGIHLTRTINGSVMIGPSAILGGAREGYRRGSFVARDVWDAVAWPGAPRLFRRHWRAGLGEIVRAASKRAFIREAQRYVPELEPDDTVRAVAGIRAQTVDRDGSLVDDFRLASNGPVLWVRNAPSPAATSSLAIAEELVERAGLS
ncbi:MAG: L-2-hydroxyglutarate oxidase [Solirubrobacterales bacterium]|nr:L-2-hydroxyglutarate oxidase [Solirubrobacterales bacterium]MBV9919042.1 L-2-hydroxyglutarate oxidase [Solirubrobacterales bacterium]